MATNHTPTKQAIVWGGIAAFLAVFLAIIGMLGIPFMERDRPNVAGGVPNSAETTGVRAR